MKFAFRLRLCARSRHPLLAGMALLWMGAILLLAQEPAWFGAARLLLLPWIYLRLPGFAWVRGVVFPASCILPLLALPALGAVETAAGLFLYAAYMGILMQPPAAPSWPETTTADLSSIKTGDRPLQAYVPFLFVAWAALLGILSAFGPEPAVGLLFAGVFALAHFSHWTVLASRGGRQPALAIILGTALYMLTWTATRYEAGFAPGFWLALAIWVLGVGKVRRKKAVASEKAA